MKNYKTFKALAALVAILMLRTLSPAVPAVLAEGSSVIFPITVQQPLGTGVPLADGVTGVDITSPYTFNYGTAAAYADESGAYDALDFYSKNATDGNNVNFGISFGQNLSGIIADPARAFLTFDFCPSAKADVGQIRIGSMYQSGGEWVKRTPINLAKHTSLAANTWKRMEFSLKDLGVTASDSAFEGIYFEYDNIAIPPSTGKLWDHVARAYDMSVTQYVGTSDKSAIPVAEGEEVELVNSDGHLVAQAKLPANTAEYISLGSLGSYSNGFTASGAAPATKDFPAYYILPMRSPSTTFEYFAQHVSGDINDYSIVLTFSRGVGAVEPIKDFEFGIGNVNGNSGYTSLPAVMKTIAVEDFGYRGAASGDSWTITVGKIGDILANGTTHEFPVSGKTMNTLEADNINLFAMKVTTGANYGGNGNLVKFTSIKLVSSGVTLTDTTTAGGDISWAAPDSEPLCYSVFKNGTKLCDTTDTTVAYTKFGTYSVYAYYGNGNYSDELVIEQPEATPASITYESGNVIFDFGGEATSKTVAIIGEYSDNTFTELVGVSIMSISGATDNKLTVPMASMANKKAFIFKDFETLVPLTAAYSAE